MIFRYPDGDASLVFTKGNSVQRLSLPPRPNSVGVVYQSPGMVNVGVDFDCVDMNLYWTEITTGSIFRSSYNGSKLEFIIKKMGSPEGTVTFNSFKSLLSPLRLTVKSPKLFVVYKMDKNKRFRCNDYRHYATKSRTSTKTLQNNKLNYRIQ